MKVEILGIGASALLGGPLTDPDGDGLDALGGATDPSWNWAGITSSHEPDFEGGENSFNIFDHKVGGGNDKWCCDDPTPGNPVWVAVEFKQPVSITHFTVASGNDTPTRDPTDWAIQGSNDGQAWTDIYHFTDTTVPWDARNQVVKFTLPFPSPAYRYIRYIAYDTPATLHQINEIEYFGVVGGTGGADADNDGMPDSWETTFSLNPKDASDAAKDLNGNGIKNLDEFKLGLDPTDATKPTIVSVAPNAAFDTVVITLSKPIFTGSNIAGDLRDAKAATNPANYSISPALAVTAVTVKGNVVTLTTAKQTPGATAYTLTISGVKDLNDWPVTPNSTTFYSYFMAKTGINSGLQAYWNFDAKNFKDSSHSFDGTGNGSVPINFVPGKTGFGQSMELDGVDQYVLITGGGPDDLAFANGSISISAWFTVASFDKSWQALIAKGEGGNWRIHRRSAENVMGFTGGAAGDTPSGTKDVSDGQWHHLVAISDATKNASSLWIDGALDATRPAVGALASNGLRMMIGDNPGARNRYWAGQVDDVAIWDRPLSEPEIAALYSNGTGKPLSGLSTFTTDLPVPAEGAYLTRTPVPNAKAILPSTALTIVHSDGKTPWTEANVTLKIDGVAVKPTFSREGDRVTLKYQPTTPFASDSSPKVSVGYTDPGGKPASTDWSFTVRKHQGQTLDKVNKIPGLILGTAAITKDGGGFSGKAGDRAIDLGMGGAQQSVLISDVGFLNAATAVADELTFSIWVKKYDIANSSAFWADSPNSRGTMRGFQAHTPWSNNNVYFDTAGCCDTSLERINAGIDTFPSYTGNISWWTNQWHHFAFSKKGSTKQIWIDGLLFLEGDNTNPLPKDFARIWLGAEGGGPTAGTANNMHGLLDDFSIFGTALSASDVGKLAAGALPSSLGASTKILAYWDFNTLPVAEAPKFTKVTKNADGSITVEWTGGGTLEAAAAITGPWQAVAGATSPYKLTPSGAAMFGRIKQ